jgi:hypothetical protein
VTYLGSKLVDNLLTANRGRTSHILEEDAAARKEKTLYNRGTRRILREYLIYLELFLKLFPLEFPRLRDFDHDARVDLVNERNASTPDPVNTWKLALDIHG